MPRPRKPAATKPFVLDCSIALAWFFADESDAYADAVANSLAKNRVVVPSLFHLEIANILVVGERRKRCTEAQASVFLARLAALPITVDGQTVARAWSDTIALARSHNLSAYDATYLELTVRESLSLASLDVDLKRAAKAIGVSEFVP